MAMHRAGLAAQHHCLQPREAFKSGIDSFEVYGCWIEQLLAFVHTAVSWTASFLNIGLNLLHI